MTGTRSGWCWQTIKARRQPAIRDWENRRSRYAFGNNHGLRRHDQQSTAYELKISIKRSGIFHRLIVQFISPKDSPWWAGSKSWVKLSPFLNRPLGEWKSGFSWRKTGASTGFNYLEALSLASNQGSQFLKLPLAQASNCFRFKTTQGCFQPSRFPAWDTAQGW